MKKSKLTTEEIIQKWSDKNHMDAKIERSVTVKSIVRVYVECIELGLLVELKKLTRAKMVMVYDSHNQSAGILILVAD
jgi:hypothetical protein